MARKKGGWGGRGGFVGGGLVVEGYRVNEHACLTEVILHTAPPGSGLLITTISIIWQSSVVGGSMNHHGHM